MAPVHARNPGVKLTFYCRLRFALTIEGVDKMDYTVIEKGPFKVMGIRRVTPFGGGTWAVVKSDGSNEVIKGLSGRFLDLGLCFGFGEHGSNDYMCAIEWEGENVPGFDSYEYPEATWLKFEAKGSISGQTLGSVWKRINMEFLPQSKYEKAGPTIEKYVAWDDAADRCEVEIWIPAVQKSTKEMKNASDSRLWN
ncbi:GyrI-like domain-containing protein [Paenibacillus macerans]|uniref:GyrI-like domain-containing protein n=1 Tax=Paenibacillus macerans TaxID=44252 RepID=UPI003D317084